MVFLCPRDRPRDLDLRVEVCFDFSGEDFVDDKSVEGVLFPDEAFV